MTLTTHMAIAAAVTKSFAASHPIIGFFAAVLSHYAADAIPHWDYTVSALQDGAEEAKDHWDNERAVIFRRRVLRDIVNFAIDGFLGAAITVALIRPSDPDQWLWAGVAIIGGALPDFLQGVYLSGASFLKPLQQFHDAAHTNIRLGHYPLIGIPFQAAILFVAAYFVL